MLLVLKSISVFASFKGWGEYGRSRWESQWNTQRIRPDSENTLICAGDGGDDEMYFTATYYRTSWYQNLTGKWQTYGDNKNIIWHTVWNSMLLNNRIFWTKNWDNLAIDSIEFEKVNSSEN